MCCHYKYFPKIFGFFFFFCTTWFDKCKTVLWSTAYVNIVSGRAGTQLADACQCQA